MNSNESSKESDSDSYVFSSVAGVDAPGTAGPSLCVREGRGCSHLGQRAPLMVSLSRRDR